MMEDHLNEARSHLSAGQHLETGDRQSAPGAGKLEKTPVFDRADLAPKI